MSTGGYGDRALGEATRNVLTAVALVISVAGVATYGLMAVALVVWIVSGGVAPWFRGLDTIERGYLLACLAYALATIAVVVWKETRR